MKQRAGIKQQLWGHCPRLSGCSLQQVPSVSGYSGIISLQMVNCLADVYLLTAVLKRNSPVTIKTERKCHVEGLRKGDVDSQVLCVLRDGKAVSAGMQLSLSEPAILPPLQFTERGKRGKTIHLRVDLSHSSD